MMGTIRNHEKVLQILKKTKNGHFDFFKSKLINKRTAKII